MKIGKYIEFDKKVGEPIFQQDGRTIRPISRTLSVWWPYGGGVWNQPAAIEVEEDGIIRELPIIHVTLWAQVGIGLLFGLISLLIWTTRKSR